MNSRNLRLCWVLILSFLGAMAFMTPMAHGLASGSDSENDAAEGLSPDQLLYDQPGMASPRSQEAVSKSDTPQHQSTIPGSVHVHSPQCDHGAACQHESHTQDEPRGASQGRGRRHGAPHEHKCPCGCDDSHDDHGSVTQQAGSGHDHHHHGAPHEHKCPCGCDDPNHLHNKEEQEYLHKTVAWKQTELKSRFVPVFIIALLLGGGRLFLSKRNP